MAELRQQYLDVLQGYGVDPAGLRSATDAQLKRILQQTAQGRDIGGEMASGAAAGQQAAKDVIGGTTPVQSLESLLAAAHTGAPTASQAGAAADLPMSQATPTALDRDLRIRGDTAGPQPVGAPGRPSMEPIPGWKPTDELVAEQHTLPSARVASAGAADLPMSEATVQPLPVDARIEQDRLRRQQEQEAARLAKQPKAQIAPGHTITIEEGGPRKKKNMLQSLAGVEVVTPSAADFGTPVEEATDEEKDIVSRQVLAQDVENVRDGGTPMISFQSDAFSSKPVDPRVADIWGEITDAEKEQYLLKYGGSEEEVKRAIEEGVLPSGAQRVQRDAAAKRPSTPVSAQRAGALDFTEDTPEDVDLMDVDLAGMAPPEKRGLLSRLGGMIKNNPEVAAQIAQAAGGLMSNIASGRAQREAGRETEGRVARANLISALTGGKTRPQVTAAQADEGGLLSRLGQITTAGGRIASGEMARRKAEGVQERELAAKELDAQSQADYRTAMADIGERQLDVDAQKNYAKFVTDYMKTMQDQAKESKLPIGELKEMGSSFATLRKLDDLEDFIVGADFSALEMGPLSLDEPSQYIFGSDASVARSKIQGLIAEIAKTVPGVLTEQDQKRLEQRLLTLNDRESTAVDLAEAFRGGMIEEIQSKMDSFEEGGGYDVSYFRGQLEDYDKGRGTEGFISALTQDELDLGYE